MAFLADTNLVLRSAPGWASDAGRAPSGDPEPARDGRGSIPGAPEPGRVLGGRHPSRDGNGLALTPEQAEAELARLENQFPVLPDTAAVYAEWRRLVTTHGVTGFRSYDARLVATMRVHGVTHILTFNVDDFRRYPEITVVHPDEVEPPVEPVE
jgi:hypothetical protein